MKQQNVYIGVYNDNGESLFYKEDDNTYYDLKKKEKVDFNEINIDFLIPYQDVIKCRLNTRRNIIRLYDINRLQKITINKLFIADSYIVTEITDRKLVIKDNELFPTLGHDVCTVTDSKGKILKRDMLLELHSSEPISCYYEFIDMETREKYERPFMPETGDIYIRNIRPAADELGIYNQKMEKRKILEKYREYSRR